MKVECFYQRYGESLLTYGNAKVTREEAEKICQLTGSKMILAYWLSPKEMEKEIERVQTKK